MRQPGKIITAAGAALFVITLPLLHYGAGQTLWGLTTRYPLILTVVAIGAGVTALAGTQNPTPILAALSLGLSAFVLGEWFSLQVPTYNDYSFGFWIDTLLALAMTVGALMAIAGSNVPGGAGARLGGLESGGLGSFGRGNRGASPAAGGAFPGAPGGGAPAGGAPVGGDPLAAFRGGGAAPQPAPAPPVQQPQPVQPAQPANPPAGWYPDPHDPGRQRYWSGTAWTEHVH